FDIFLWLFSLALFMPHSGGGRIILQSSASMSGWESQPISYKFRLWILMPPGTFDMYLSQLGEGLIIHHIHPMYISASLTMILGIC
ncbi:hypothetical protein DFH07DRAFT_842030, partial [Mycena maculata]